MSVDLDFILSGSPEREVVDRAMASVGFRRRGERYVHPRVPFYVEFPRGPLAIGEDLKIRPRLYRGAAGEVQLLSPTDCCRDRLAAFYHWKDRQSLDVAVTVALRQPLSLGVIRRWSVREGKLDEYEEFLRQLRIRRARKRVARGRR